MRNELNEVSLIDDFLFRQLNEDETRAVETRQLLDAAFALNVAAQRTAHRFVRQYGRREDRRRFDAIYRRLVGEVDFGHQIKAIFS